MTHHILKAILSFVSEVFSMCSPTHAYYLNTVYLLIKLMILSHQCCKIGFWIDILVFLVFWEIVACSRNILTFFRIWKMFYIELFCSEPEGVMMY